MSMHLQLVSGAPNVTFTAPNKFTFTLPSPYQASDQDRVSLKSLRMYYSWFNMTAAKKNNSLSYTWVDNTVHTVTLPDGIWSFLDFQTYLEQVMFSKKHYLLDNNARPVYYIRFESNSVFYRISLSVNAVPAVLPSGHTAPAGWVAPATNKTPVVHIPATAIRSYLGFEAGSYPSQAQATLFQINGQNVPQVTDITSLMLQSNLVNNEYGPDSRTLASFNVEPGTEPGSLISEIPFYQDWIPMQMARFSQIVLTLVDQNSRPVKIEDTAGFIATLNIERMK